MLSIQEYGAAGDGQTVHTDSIQKALDVCGESGGGTVVVPPGCFLSGPLTLRSNVTLHLDAGAVLKAVPWIEGWPVVENPCPAFAEQEKVYKPFIGGVSLQRVSVTGRGVLDGSGAPWWEARRAGKLEVDRPALIRFVESSDVLLEGIKLIDSACWTVHPVCCDNVTIRGLTLQNPPDSPNTDGINPDSCRHVHISDCHIDVGDDCVTLKAGTETARRPAAKRVCEDIVVTNCTMVHGHGGVVCGSEMSGSVRNVVISNCVFQGIKRGLRFKCRRGRGGIIENVRASNIVMENVKVPFLANNLYGCGAQRDQRVTDPAPHPVDEGTPRTERLRFAHITARNAEFVAAALHGLPEMPLRDILFHDVDIHIRPDAGEGSPASAGTLPVMRRRGFFCRYVENLRLESVRIDGHEGPRIDAANCGIEEST